MPRLKMGMVGGGQGAFIGAVHRIALAMDGEFELTAGAFSRDPANSKATGESLHLDSQRCYASFEEMAQAESRRRGADRLDAIAIVTPNHVHHPAAKRFLEAGFHVICDKPMTVSLEEARDLARVVERTGRLFALTHNYSGYPLVEEARRRIQSGELGEIRKVYAEYLQGWLSEPLEATGQKQASWRTDPAQSGPVGALGDIGTHAFQLLEHVTGLRVERLFAVLKTFVPGRRLDDDDTCLLELSGGAGGTLHASQVCFGRENGLALRVFGTRGALAWAQEHPNDLHLTRPDGSVTTLRTATGATSAASRALTRTPSGHPEGYLEGFANIYRAFARAIRGESGPAAAFPTVQDGVRGLLFIDAALRSSRSGQWISL